jgi:hypothetical protein
MLPHNCGEVFSLDLVGGWCAGVFLVLLPASLADTHFLARLTNVTIHVPIGIHGAVAPLANVHTHDIFLAASIFRWWCVPLR